jgi:hypothetical protein
MKIINTTLIKIKLKWLTPKERIHSKEANVVRSSRILCFQKLVSDGWADSTWDESRALILFTFERCGIIANIARDVINGKEGFVWFSVINIGGHYVLKSNITGLIYDLVGTEGIPCSEKKNLPYAEYLRLVADKQLNRDDVFSRFKADYFSEFLDPR